MAPDHRPPTQTVPLCAGLPIPSEANVEASAAELLSRVNPKRHVGHKHHTVPRFILQRFANAKDQVMVRDRISGDGRISNIRNLAIKDFYTFIDLNGELDASYEQLFGMVEAPAADVLRAHLDNPFSRPRPFDPVEKHCIDALVALQFLRGPAPRRSNELVADYGVKLMNQTRLSQAELEEYEFVPHQNDHLKVMAGMVEKVELHLATRAACLVSLDRPLLVICDEPVCLERPEEWAPPSRKQLRDFPRGVLVDGVAVDPRSLVQIQGRHGGVGLMRAEAIAMPVSPRHAIVYDRPGTAGPASPFVVQGTDADEFAAELLTLCLEQAARWIASHPDHDKLRRMPLPPPRPLVTVYDGGTTMGRQARTVSRRTPKRLNKDAR